MNKSIEVMPKEVLVEQNGNLDPARPVSAALLVKWIRPNDLQSEVAGAIPNLELIGGVPYRDFPISRPEELLRNQLLKTQVVGRSVITAEVIVAKDPTLLHEVVMTLIGVTFGKIPVPTPYASALLGLVKGKLQKAVLKKQVISLGRGFYKIKPKKTLKSSIKINLTAPRPLVAVVGMDDHGMPVNEYETMELVGAGEPNGHVVLDLNSL